MEITFKLDLPKTIDLETVIRHDAEYDEEGMKIGERPVTVGEEILRRVVNTIEYKVQSELGQAVKKRIEEVAGQKVEALMHDAIEATFQRTDQWGNPHGKPTTLREIILDQVKDFLEKPRRKSTYDRPTTKIQEFIEEGINHHFSSELHKAIDEGKKQATAAVQKHAAEVLAKTISRMAEKGGA